MIKSEEQKEKTMKKSEQNLSNAYDSTYKMNIFPMEAPEKRERGRELI